MEAVKLFEKKGGRLDWEYDGDADTLYIRMPRENKLGWLFIMPSRQSNRKSNPPLSKLTFYGLSFDLP